MVLRQQTYDQLVLEDPSSQWELFNGCIRRKPGMTFEHNHVSRILGYRLQMQLPLDKYVVSVNTGRARHGEHNAFIPDVMVIPVALMPRFALSPGGVEAYSDPLPLVVEVWSPSTGEYDVETKFPIYRAQGHAEIWRIHPYERVVTMWRRREDGSYNESRLIEGDLVPVALPGVSIPFAELFR